MHLSAYPLEQAVPTDFAVKPSTVFVKRQPYNNRFAHYVIFGHKTPIAGVGGVVTVVTHHPVIIHLKGISVGLFTVDVDTVRFDFQFVAFVSYDATFVDRKIILCQRNGGSLGRNPDRAVVVPVMNLYTKPFLSFRDFL